ncbi:MAG: potassium channel protein [Myxococcales bacterium]|nr:potassium channel protein [Myxococcales bacterium]
MQEDPIQRFLVARRRMFLALGLLAWVIAGGAAGYWYIGNRISDLQWSVGDCIYMTAITISTVGYAEVLPLAGVTLGREWTLGLLVFGISANVYVTSAITSFFVESDFVNIRRIRRNQKRREKMKNHYIVCGAGGTGAQVVREMLSMGEKVIAIDVRSELLDELQTLEQREEPTLTSQEESNLVTLVGDATDDDTMLQAGIQHAKGLVATLDDDKTNMFMVVSARQTNPKLRIVAKAGSDSASKRLRRAGADAVVTPTRIGGLRLASELLRPRVVEFLDEMLRDRQSLFRIEEATVSETSSVCNKLLREADLRSRTEVLIIAVRESDGPKLNYVPKPDMPLQAGMTLIGIGTPSQIQKLRKLVGHP